MAIAYAKKCKGKVEFYRDKECIDLFAVNPYESRPTKRNKYVTLNGYKYKLEWVN